MSDVPSWITKTLAAVTPYLGHVFAITLAMIGGGLKYASKVRNRVERWSLVAFVLETATAAFFGYLVFLGCLYLLHLSIGAAAAAAGVVGHMGAEQTSALAETYFKSRFK